MPGGAGVIWWSGARQLEVRPFRRYLHDDDTIFESLKFIYSNGDDLTKNFAKATVQGCKKKLQKVLVLYQQHPCSLVP